jgi:hypothetical protein
MHQVNWVKVELRPTILVFHGSADGKAWTRDWEVARPEALRGPPVRLRLGKMPTGDEAPHRPTPTPAHFDDLIVARLQRP